MLSLIRDQNIGLDVKLKTLANVYSFFFEGHSDTITHICVNSECGLVASAAIDKSVRIWSVGSRSQTSVFSEVKGGVYSILISFCGKYLICGTGQKEVKIFNIKSRAEENSFFCESKLVWKIAATSDCKYIIAGTTDRVINIWNFFKRKEAAKLEGHKSGVTDLIVHRDKVLVSAGFDGLFIVWDLLYMNMRFKVVAHQGHVNQIKIENSLVFSASKDGSVKVWDLENSELIGNMKAHREGVLCICVQDDFVVSGGEDKLVIVWNLLTLDVKCRMIGHDKPVFFVGFTESSNFVVSGSSNCIKTWTADGTAYESFEIKRVEFRKVAVVKEWFIFGGSNFGVQGRDVERKAEIKFDGHLDIVSFLKPISDDLVITGGNDGSVRIWEVKKKKEVTCYWGHKRCVMKVSYTKSLKYFVSCSLDKYYCVWRNSDKTLTNN